MRLFTDAGHMLHNPLSRFTRWSLLIAVLSAGVAHMKATPPSGFTSQTSRGKITSNVSAHQWNDNPLFTLLIQSSPDNWGLDLVQGTTEFAAADSVSGRPSQSGWHDHPTVLSIAVVVQGTVWSQAAGSNCLQALPMGTVFTERMGQIHNNYNLDPRSPAVVRITHFVDRNQSATRRDQPDPTTGSTSTAAPPPTAICTADSHNASESVPWRR
jgi:quercetin dioxygenase-like cupin family protein